MPVRVDVRGLPLVCITYVGEYSDEELSAYLATLERVLARPGRKVALIDLLKATVATASQRRRQADWIATHEAVLRCDFGAAAIVLDSALLRGAVTAVFWMRPLPLPTEIVGTVDAALAWLAPHLASPAQPVPRRTP